MTWRSSTRTRSPGTATRTCSFSPKRFTEKSVGWLLVRLSLNTQKAKISRRLAVTGTRSIPWTDSETLLLINTWGEDTLQQELRMTHRTGHIFTIISNRMSAQGFSRTPEQCQTRLKRLKLNFRQSYHNKCVWGGAAEAGGGVQDAAALLLFVLLSSLKELEQVHCKFYNELGRVLVKDFVPVQQADDLCGEADEDAPSSVPQDMGECSPPV